MFLRDARETTIADRQRLWLSGCLEDAGCFAVVVKLRGGAIVQIRTLKHSAVIPVIELVKRPLSQMRSL